MAKCGKGCMPECEYFTTGGCISPFNCPYKIETGYINSATSIPTYMGQYNGMSNDDIERCLERLATCKTTDVMNFDYAGTLAYIKRLKSENADLHARLKEAELRARLDRAVELPCKVGDTVYHIQYFCNYKKCDSTTQQICCGCKEMIERERRNEKYVICEKPFELKDLTEIGKKYFTTRAEAEARLKELQGGER